MKVSRREFFRDAAAVSAAAAAAGVLGAPAMAAPGVPDKWDAEADIIVVGTGIAGYSAAIEAKDAGASVIVIDKAKFYGGMSLLSGGNCQMPANHINAKAGVEDKVEWAYEDYITNGKHRGVPEIMKVFVEGAADTALWLEKLGIVWRGPTLQLPDCRVPRTITPDTSPNYHGRAGISLIDVLHQNAVKREIPVKLEHRMTRIIRQEGGPVVGIEVENAGNKLSFKAKKAVILASGGYKANYQMIRAWHPMLDEPWGWTGGPYVENTGDGHLAAMAIGAGLTDASFTISYYVRFGTSTFNIWEPQAIDAPVIYSGVPFRVGNTSVVMVNADGKRFVNEATFNPGEAELENPWIEAYLALPQRPRNVWAIVDAVGAVDMKWKLEDFQKATLEKSPYLDPKYVAWGDTIEELAGKMGISVEGLAAEIKKYNGYVATGKDKDFGRPMGFTTIAQKPFMAAKMTPLTHDQSNGIRVNSKMQVIDQMFQMTTGTQPSVAIDQEGVIPHLYGAGEFCGGLFGASRGHGKMGSYSVLGRVAAKNALQEKPWDAAA